jgi:hypothetical protein
MILDLQYLSLPTHCRYHACAGTEVTARLDCTSFQIHVVQLRILNYTELFLKLLGEFLPHVVGFDLLFRSWYSEPDTAAQEDHCEKEHSAY